MKIEKIIEKKIRKISKKRLQLHKPFFDKSEVNLLKSSIKSTFVSTTGYLSKKFESNLKKIIKSKYLIATNSGTSALHAALCSLDLKKNDEILVPSLSFVAPVNAICYVGCIPHFIDTEKNYPLIDIDKLEKHLKKNTKLVSGKCFNKSTKKFIKAIIVVHMFGHCVDMKRIKNLASRYRIKVIEDAAEALGSKLKGKQVGTFADIGIISFNGNKIITTGAGGAIITDSKKIYLKSKKLVNVGKTGKWKNEHDIIGYNYGMPSLNAALGISQLKKLSKLVKFKRDLFKKYKNIFSNLEYLSILEDKKNYTSNYWLQTILLKESFQKHRDRIINHLNNKNIQTRPCWKLIHTLKPYRKFPKMNLINSQNLEKKIINLPSGYDVK